MEYISEKYKIQLDQIWNREDFKTDPIISKYIKRGYAFSHIEKASAIFVGLNPSFSNNKEESFLYYLNDAVKDQPNYYGRYNQLAQKAGIDWIYLDLFYFKETDSRIVDNLLKNPVAIQFLVEQLKVTQAIIEEISPKVMVVFNAKARKFLGLEQNREKNEGIWMGYLANDEKLYQKFGTHVISEVESGIINSIKHKKQVPIPIFFDSFITYQPVAAIDRLAWHINYALKIIEKV